jgi:type IV secretory pathway VirB4 component
MSAPDQSICFNPLKSTSKSEVKDLIMASSHWSEEFYKTMAQSELLNALTQIKEVSISKIIESLPDIDALQGLVANLNVLRKEDYGHKIDGVNYPGLLDFYRDKKVVFFSLNVQSFPESAVHLGRVILCGLMGISNYAQSEINEKDRHPTTLVIDEFGSFFTPTFINFLNKGRSANFRIIMATQSIGDLTNIGDSSLSQILDNTAVKIIMRMGDANSREYCAKIFGTVGRQKASYQIQEGLFYKSKTGMGNVRDALEFIVHPDDIKVLENGQGYVMTQSPYSASFVKFNGPDKSIPIIKYIQKHPAHRGTNSVIEKVKSSGEGITIGHIKNQNETSNVFPDNSRKSY